jgi:benzoate 4-monooxygenase
MELHCIAATVFENFEFRLERERPLETREDFLRKPLGLSVEIRRRQSRK